MYYLRPYPLLFSKCFPLVSAFLASVTGTLQVGHDIAGHSGRDAQRWVGGRLVHVGALLRVVAVAYPFLPIYPTTAVPTRHPCLSCNRKEERVQKVDNYC